MSYQRVRPSEIFPITEPAYSNRESNVRLVAPQPSRGFREKKHRPRRSFKKSDLLAVAHYLIGHLSYRQVPALAKRHKVEAKMDSAPAQELLAKQANKYDESELCKLLLAS